MVTFYTGYYLIDVTTWAALTTYINTYMYIILCKGMFNYITQLLLS